MVKLLSTYHSVTLDVDKCKGCTNCIKGCPTEAIRVRNGRAYIIENKCIDCGECIRICPNSAKYAVTDNLKKLNKFKFKIALPAPSFYGQFKKNTSVGSIKTALRKIGFDEVYEVSLAAEEVAMAIRLYIKQNAKVKPLISSSCPAVLRLIQVRFPELIKNIIPIKSPMEIAARNAKLTACQYYDIDVKDIGVFFISPCPAKVTSIKQPIGTMKSYVDGAFSFSDIYSDVVKNITKSKFESMFTQSSGIGIRWGITGGENISVGLKNHLTVDGIQNCINALEEVEMNKLSDINYIECQACAGGCIGGPLTIENRFVATSNIYSLSEKIGFKDAVDKDNLLLRFTEGYFNLEEAIPPKPFMKLDENISKAIKKMELLRETVKQLPGLDCGSCGAPNCRALAEDIVQDLASETDCVFRLRDKVKQLVEEMLYLSKKLPPTMDINKQGSDDD